MVARFWVREQDGVARRRFPVTGGFALPAGRLTDPARLVLTDAEGQAMPLQALALTRWPDGSARWVLLDLQTDLAAHETRFFSLDRTDQRDSPRVLADRRRTTARGAGGDWRPPLRGRHSCRA